MGEKYMLHTESDSTHTSSTEYISGPVFDNTIQIMDLILKGEYHVKI